MYLLPRMSRYFKKNHFHCQQSNVNYVEVLAVENERIESQKKSK
jgi:hypothetical protein